MPRETVSRETKTQSHKTGTHTRTKPEDTDVKAPLSPGHRHTQPAFTVQADHGAHRCSRHSLLFPVAGADPLPAVAAGHTRAEAGDGHARAPTAAGAAGGVLPPLLPAAVAAAAAAAGAVGDGAGALSMEVEVPRGGGGA
jgi:hypothetical protein